MTRDNIATARTLSEALPYLQRFNDAIVVVKFGGNAMGDDAAMAASRVTSCSCGRSA
jgi:acetylglutamate kinase